MARVGALVATTALASISWDVDAVRAFEVITGQRASDPATSAGLRPAPCAWRALFSANHIACDAAIRRCKKCNKPTTPAYNAAVEQPIVDLVKPLLVDDLRRRVVPP